MFEKIVERIINQILGQYVEGFNSQNLHIGIWKGQVVIQNVKLKNDVIKKFNLPFHIKYSKLGSLKMIIPWSSLSSSKIQVFVEGLQLLITEVPEQFWECKNHKIIQQRKKQIQNFCDSIIADFAKKTSNSDKDQKNKQQGYFSNMVMKIIDNVQVVVKDIHIRFEDCITNRYSFGVTLQQLKIYTVNKHGEPEFIDRTKKNYQNQPLRKKLLLSNLGIYWNENSQFFKQSQPHAEMIDCIYRKDSSNKRKMDYLLLMSFNAMLFQRQSGKQFELPQINLIIEFDELKIQISNMQLQQIVTLGERLQKFTNQVKSQNRKKLTQLQMIANRQIILQLFPNFFMKKSTPAQIKQIDNILQKMETQNFQEGIRLILQEKQKQKMVQQRIQKSRGWFSGPRELTQQQLKQIEEFVVDNFGKQAKVVKRPQQYYYIRINFNLKLLQVAISNKNEMKNIKQGIRLRLEEIKMQFNLRQQGYMLNFLMNNIRLDLFKSSLQSTSSQQIINVVQALSKQYQGKVGQYVKLQVYGNPLHKRYLDTEIFLQTEELLIQFHPKLIKIATDFANIKLSAQNSEAALQAYGEIRSKAAMAANQSLKKPFVKKNFISLDVKISSVSLLLYFNPLKQSDDIWIVKIGETRIYSDPQIVKKIQFGFDQPMQKYGLSLAKISFMHFANKNAYFYSKTNPNMQIQNKQKVINQLSIDFQIQLFKNPSQKIPKIRAKTILHNIDIYLSQFTYQAIQKINQSFILPTNTKQIQNKEKQRISLKSQVMKQAKKIGIVYNISKQGPRKFIGVLNGPYLYLYKDKKDIQYTEYYYLKNCEITEKFQPQHSNLVYEATFKNSLNNLKLGFEKQANMREWIKIIKAIDVSQQQYKPFITEDDKKKQKIEIKEGLCVFSPDKLNFQIWANIQRVGINTLFPNNKQIVVTVKQLETKVKIHQAKNVIQVSLHSIQVRDNVYIYKYKQLQYFLYSTAIEGKQKLIQVNIVNFSPSHPLYDYVDAKISAQFGKLICNYKPQTMEKLMNFYVPKDNQMKKKREQKGGQLTKQQKQIYDKQKKKRKVDQIQKQLRKGSRQCFLLQIRLKIGQISASLVNRKNRVMFSKLGLTKFELYLGLSSRRILVSGKLKQMWFEDYSNYPYTIYQEQQSYTKVHYIVQSSTSTRDMLNFNVQLLQIPNIQGKTILVKTQVYDIKASYIQQPVLRVITYLLQQILPSLTPPQDLSKPKQVPRNDVKPELSTIDLLATVENVVAVVQPRTNSETLQYLQLTVSKIQVRNSSHFREYVKNREQNEQKVSVENYLIKMYGIKIMQKLGEIQTKLTNDLDFDVSCDLIQNPPYYRKLYGSRFDAGMRIQCKLTPFLLCINHDDYNFIMKCLYWNIIYDDNAEGYFFSGAVRQSIQATQPVSEPIHFGLTMSKIIACVMQENFPLSVLLLNQMRYDLTLDEEGMHMVFKMKHLFGTTISKTSDQKISLQRGMFNSFGYEKKHATQDLNKMQNLVNSFSRSQLNYKQSNEYVVYFKMTTQKMTGLSNINIKIKDIGIAIQLKTLLTLSKLALMQDYIQPPKSLILPIHSRTQTQNSGMNINIEMNNFLGCLGDRNFQNYIVMEGAFYIKIKMLPNKTQDQILIQSKSQQTNGRFSELSSYAVEIKNYSLYFCNVDDLKNKRFILMPLNIYLIYGQFYSKIHEQTQIQSEIDGMLDKVLVECSVKDMMMINKILQQNLQTLAEANKPKPHSTKRIILEKKESKDSQDPNNSLIVNQNIKIDSEALKKTIKQVQKKIKSKMKATIKLQPIQVRVVNDCGHNFMPVVNLILQESSVLFSSNSTQSRFVHLLIMKLDFFNPRAASWQPIIQTFQICVDYMTKIQQNSKSKIVISSSEIQQLRQLKINISTQLITTILATLELAKKQKQQINESKKKEDVQISPYILQNKSNQIITIHREIDHAKSSINLNPLFKGPVRLTDGNGFLKFTYFGKTYEISLEKFGAASIPRVKNMHLQFKIDKLNRIISFVDRYTIKNNTTSKLYCVRYNEKREKLQQYLQFASQDTIPVKSQWLVQFSFNLKTFTPPTKISSLSKIVQLKAESERFKLSISKRKSILQHEVLSIRAPFLISNSLPKDIKLQFISNGKHVSTRQISAQTTHEVYANEDLSNLKFKIITQGFYWSQQFWMDYTRLGQQQDLHLNDRQKGSACIKYIFQRDQKRSQFKFNIYCPAFILSQLEQDVHIYGNLDRQEKNKSIQKYYLLGGQSEFWKKAYQIPKDQQNRVIDKVTLVGTEIGSKLRICGSNCIVDFSEPFTINSIGVHQARVVVERQIYGKKMGVFTMLALEIQPKKMAKFSNVVSKQITLRYRYIIYNNTQHDLFIKEEGSQKMCFFISKGQKKPFFYTVPSLGLQSRKMVIRTPQTNQSLPIPSNSLGVAYFRLENYKKKGQHIYFNINTKQIKSYIFYQFNELKYENLPYQVLIKSPKFKVFVPNFDKVLTKTSQSLLFINQLPQQPLNLFMLISLIDTEQSFEMTVQTDNLNFKKSIRFLNKITNLFTVCLVQVIFSDSKKFIVIDQKTGMDEDITEYQIQSILVKLQKLSISFIQNHAQVQKPYEAFYFYMYNIDLVMAKSNLYTRYQARLQFLQFDQDQPFNIPDPVIVTPYKHKQFVSNDPKDKPKSVFNALVVIDNTFVKNTFFNVIAIDINDLVIRANTYFLKMVMSMVKEYNDVFKTQSQFLIKRQVDTWKQINIPPEGRKTFIKCIKLAPFTVQISAQIRLNELDVQSVIFFGTIINALGVVITNIQNAPIVFDGIILANCIDTVQGIQQKLIQHYKTSVLRQLYKVFGSLNIIGNPVSLFRNISTGIKDLKDKPSQGFVEGPLQFGMGLAQGTGSLIAHSVGGVLNSVQKVTGTFASGLAVLTFDKQFEEAREKEKMKKPKHVFQGLQKGGKAVFHGFKQGITGVITQPIQHTKKQGVAGFFKGTAKGVAGLVVKPVTGVVDFTSKTFEGLKNTALYLEDRPNQTRIRYPRVFYTQCGVIREYNPIDSVLSAIINKTKYQDRYGFQNMMFMNSFMINTHQFVLVLKQDVIKIRVNNEKIQWAVPLENLIIVKQSQSQLRISANSRRQWYTKKVNQVVQFNFKQDVHAFMKLIDQLRINMRDKFDNRNSQDFE